MKGPDEVEAEATAIWGEMHDNLSDMLTKLPSVPIRPEHEDYDDGGWNRRLTKESGKRFDRAFEGYVRKLEAIGVSDARKRATEKWYR